MASYNGPSLKKDHAVLTCFHLEMQTSRDLMLPPWVYTGIVYIVGAGVLLIVYTFLSGGGST